MTNVTKAGRLPLQEIPGTYHYRYRHLSDALSWVQSEQNHYELTNSEDDSTLCTDVVCELILVNKLIC